MPCASCGRTFWPGARHTRRGSTPRYCSAACRKHRVKRIDNALELAIVALLARRAPGASICPSEAARHVAGDDGGWRELMEPARRAARRLAHRGLVVLTQRGRPVDPGTFKGPIRIRPAREQG